MKVTMKVAMKVAMKMPSDGDFTAKRSTGEKSSVRGRHQFGHEGTRSFRDRDQVKRMAGLYQFRQSPKVLGMTG